MSADHRLVANTLESDWNERLRRLDTLQQEHDRQRKADQNLLNEEARARMLAAVSKPLGLSGLKTVL